MQTLITVLEVVLPIGYGLLLYVFGSIFFRSGPVQKAVRKSYPFAMLLFFVHAVYIGLWTLQHGRCLLATFVELSSLISFTLLGLYLLVEARLKSEAAGTGFFVLAVSFSLQTVSSLLIHSRSDLPEAAVLFEPLFNVHVTTAIIGYAALMLAAIYGALYLLLFQAIKSNHYGPVFEHLPNLERLERYGIRAMGVGFVFLTVAIAVGVVLAVEAHRTFGTFIVDPKILATLGIWLIFGVTLFLARVKNVEGRQLVLFWMGGFVVTLLSLSIVNLFTSSYHRFL